MCKKEFHIVDTLDGTIEVPNDEKDPQIERHIQHIKEVKEKLNRIEALRKLTADVMLRRTGAINNHDGTYNIRLEDLYAWFINGDHLREYNDYDLL